jgi:hypothetical protein
MKLDHKRTRALTLLRSKTYDVRELGIKNKEEMNLLIDNRNSLR